MPPNSPSRELPTRLEALLFGFKTRGFQLRRLLRELGQAPPYHRQDHTLEDTPVLGQSTAPIWTQTTAAEFPLTAGKIENLRVAARSLNGLEIPANQTFSFWRQLGRTTRGRGFTTGRELREGCLVPSRGGGLCQLSGLLYQAALDAGLKIIERHAHSRTIPGSAAERGQDATVFWNYVDLRFQATAPWRLEVDLTATELIVRIRSGSPKPRTGPLPPAEDAPRPPASGDCLTCNQTGCFRHPSATADHAPTLGHSAFLLDARWPEFDQWCAGHSRDGDHWFTPLDGQRWRKPNYDWHPPTSTTIHHATLTTLQRSLTQRRLPAQGAIRQAALLKADADLAKYYNDRISPECRHLVISQNLLPHLWQLGTLGGRTFDVLMTRLPLAQLHDQLNTASTNHPNSPTLGDFRANEELVRAESAALKHAGRLITPHCEIAQRFGQRAWLIDWESPKIAEPESHTAKHSTPALRLFLPCSPLGRKGIHELTAALDGTAHELLVLGHAREDSSRDPLRQINWRTATLAELPDCDALILPAWVEHQPRLALRALALGVPVIATTACGLPNHPLLHTIAAPHADDITAALASLITPLSSAKEPPSPALA